MQVEPGDNNPYAAPKAELGVSQLREDQPRRRRPPPRWLWPILVLLNAIAGLVFSSSLMKTPYHTAGILAGIVVVGTPYALLEMVFRRRQFLFLADMLYFGAAIRIPFQLYPIAEVFAAMGGSLFLQQAGLLPDNQGGPTPWSNFLMTVVVGTQLAVMAFILGLLPAVVRHANRTR
jgi:hypothetical protein